MAQKMLVGDKDTVLLLPAFEIVGVPNTSFPTSGVGTALPITGITSALLNYYLPANTPGSTGAKWGGNITCAIVNDMKLELKSSSTKNIKTLCSVGQALELTYYNYDAVMNFLRDINPADATSEFNLPITLTSAPDVAYIIAHRLGYSRTVAAAAGQEWNFYYAWTDYQIPTTTDGEYQQVAETFVPKGIINFKAVLSA